MLHRPRRQRAGARLRLFRGGAGTESGAFSPKTTPVCGFTVMYQMTYRTSHRLIDVVVFRDIFENKALNERYPLFGHRYIKSGMRE